MSSERWKLMPFLLIDSIDFSAKSGAKDQEIKGKLTLLCQNIVIFSSLPLHAWFSHFIWCRANPIKDMEDIV